MYFQQVHKAELSETLRDTPLCLRTLCFSKIDPVSTFCTDFFQEDWTDSDALDSKHSDDLLLKLRIDFF